MGKKMAVVGAGAAGSYIGAFLAREGHDIVLIDMWGEHVEKMNSDGIDVSGSQGPFNVPVQAYHFYDASQLKDKYDIIFFAMKSYDTTWAAHFAKKLLAPDGVLVSNQNCMNDLTLASIVGFEREIPCVMSGITVGLWEPAHVNRGGKPGRDRGHDVFRVGELHGRITPRAEEIAELLSCIDGSRATSNIWGERWSKLTTNASSNPITAMTGLGSNGAAEIPEARRLQIEISKESCQVALAHNFDIEPIKGIAANVWVRADEGDVFEELDEKFLPNPGANDWKSSMAQDVTKGRKTEVTFMNGYISEQGELVGIPTPINTAITSVVHEIDSGIRQADVRNIKEVMLRAGIT
jgi:2-dehydropantoate 2-reductase